MEIGTYRLISANVGWSEMFRMVIEIDCDVSRLPEVHAQKEGHVSRNNV